MAAAKPVLDALEQADAALREAITRFFEEIQRTQDNEREYIDLWAAYGKKVAGFFQAEAERTGNGQLARYIKKNLTKSMIFS
jgi:2-succinyl-5-enolpyruvyl-6-hydroxy-3-cyclohexene-1-carboxylate synthase